MIYTTNFAKLRNITTSNKVVISICAFNPKWLKQGDIDYWFKFLAPSQELLYEYKYGTMDWNKYTNRYIKEFWNSKQAKEQANSICRLSKEKDVFLVCYEKSADNCHRHILAKLLMEKGYSVQEY